MLKSLLKKQMLEMTSFLFKNKKGGRGGKNSSSNTMIVYALLMLYSVGFIGYLFYQTAQTLCKPLIEAQMDWLFFALVALIATGLGVIGSVFMSYSTLYDAKDNELLLSMPIPSRYILFSRMTAVYLMSLVFEAIAMIPAIIVYVQMANPSILAIVFEVIILLILPLFAVIISCILGYFIAIIASHMKNKSIITVVISLVFLAVYFYFYMNVNDYLQSIVTNSKEISSMMSTALYPIYQLGLACVGNPLGLIIFAAILLAAFAVVYLILSHSYIKLTTTKRGAKKTKYVEKTLKVSSQTGAIFKKENSRFIHTPIYMLNCGLGTIFLVIIAVLALFNVNNIQMLTKGSDAFIAITPLLAVGVICFAAGMNNISAPSISLEGKSLWIIQSLPVSSWRVLKSKIKVHILYTMVPVLLCAVIINLIICVDVASIIMITLFTVLYVLFSAEFGLIVNLKFPSLDWSNETVAVKQSASVIVSMLANWAILLILLVPFFVFPGFFTSQVYLAICVAVLALVVVLLTLWLKKRGTKAFEEL